MVDSDDPDLSLPVDTRLSEPSRRMLLLQRGADAGWWRNDRIPVGGGDVHYQVTLPNGVEVVLEPGEVRGFVLHAAAAVGGLERVAYRPGLLDEETLARWQAELSQQRTEQRRRDQQVWEETLTDSQVADRVEVRYDLRDGPGGSRRELAHVVPTRVVWSGPVRSPQRYPKGHALCEVQRPRQLVLAEPTEDPATCGWCLARVRKVQPTKPGSGRRSRSKGKR